MTGSFEIRTFATAQQAAVAMGQLIAEQATEGGHIAVSGGSTIGAAYGAASERLDDWSGATLWWGDDRAVPPDHELSNFRLVRETLLDRLPEDGRPAVERILGEEGHEAAAGDYEARVRHRLGNSPRFDLMLMGLGPDGHTASLFPGKPEVGEEVRFVVGVPVAGMEPQVPRVTMTLPVINASSSIVFLIAGAEKAANVARCFGPDPDPSLPGALVRPSDGRMLVLLDEAAASRLPG